MIGMILLMVAGMLAIGWAETIVNLLRGGYVPAPIQLQLLTVYAGFGFLLGFPAGLVLLWRRRSRRAALRFSLPLSLLVAAYGLMVIYDPHSWAGETAYLAVCLAVACILAALGRHVRLSFSWLLVRQVAWGLGLVAAFNLSESMLAGSAACRAFCLPFAVAAGELAWTALGPGWRRVRSWMHIPAYSTRGVWFLFAALLLSGISLSEHRQAQFSPLQLSESPKPRAEGGKNVVIISLDTTRSDHLSLYGYPKPTTPSLERLASDAAVFSRCIATSAWTLPTHASIFTGLYPSRHGAHLAGKWMEMRTRLGMPAVAWSLDEEQVTLAEILRARGYSTAAVVANFSYLFRDFGLAQGFSYYSDAPRFMFRRRPAIVHLARGIWPAFMLKAYRSARDINSEAFSWLDEHLDNPFLLFVNYMEPHHPWLAETDGSSWWQALSRGPSAVDHGNVYTHEFKVMDADDRSYIQDQYDGEIAEMDRALGELVEGLKRRGLYENSLIVVVGDHGELLGEHDSVGHIARMLYDELLWVPLVVKYPRSILKGRFDSAVQQVDIFPTVLAALGLAIPPAIQGEELPVIRHPIIAEQYTHGYLVKKYGDRYDRDLTAIYLGDKKYIESSKGTKFLFDLANDPREARNLAKARPTVVEAAAKELAKWTKSRPALSAKKRTVVSDTARERLRALGYVN